MDDKLKHRLVGATVILAIMAFFLPLILDSEKYRSSIVSQIPPISNSSNLAESDNTNQDPVAESPSESEAAKETGPLLIDLNQESPPVNSQKASKAVTTDETLKNSKQVSDNLKTKVETQASIKEAQAGLIKKGANADKVKAVVAAAPAEQQIAEKTKAIVNLVKEKSVEPATKTVKEVKLTPQFQEQAWVIQIGTFSSKENATKLVTDLRNNNYRAYQRLDEKYSRVYVGPYPDKKAASSRQRGLEKLVSSKVKLIEFDPKAH